MVIVNASDVVRTLCKNAKIIRLKLTVPSRKTNKMYVIFTVCNM